jgi:hypothetical protein
MATVGGIATVLEGVVEAAADIAEHSGGIVGTQEAQTLSVQIASWCLHPSRSSGS